MGDPLRMKGTLALFLDNRRPFYSLVVDVSNPVPIPCFTA